MKRIIVSVLIVSFFLSSCTHSFQITKYETNLQFYKKINDMCDGIYEIILRTTDGKELRVNNFIMMPDSSQYINLLNNKTEFVNTNTLKEMVYKETSRGIFDGGGLGLASGGIAGLVVGAILIKFQGPTTEQGGMGSLFTLIGCFLIGVTAGLITGSIWGGIHQSTIILDLQQHQNPKGQK
jgi:hypothetical protein